MICIGKFDGLHIGHRLILDTLLDDARRRGASSVVYSFEPRNGAPRLTTREEKRDLFASLGIDHLVVAELTEEFMAMPADAFIERLASCGRMRAVAVGRDFRFGRGASGDVELLKQLGLKHGFDVHAIGQVEVNGRPISSTSIRDAVKSGDVEMATLLLGREYSLSGEVVEGRRLARQMGFRTANIVPPHGKAIPAYGVYAAYVDFGPESRPAMTNIGVKPTVGGHELLIESHLLGFEGDLYGKKITVRLVKRIRDEIKFESVGQLAGQLDDDRSKVMQIMSISR